MALDDAIARFSRVSLAFKDFTTRETPPASRLAHLVLNLPVRDFLREADETERGLYTIVRASNPGAKDSIGGIAGPSTHGAQPKTVDVATPLKHQNSTRAGRVPGKVQKKGKGRALDDARDPEVPLRAALKLVDIYHGMPRYREHILERIETEHRRKKTIAVIQKELDELNLSTDGPSDPDNPVLADLEREIRNLQRRNEEYRQKRDSLVQKRAERKLARDVSPVTTPIANRHPTAVPGSTRKSIFGHSYLSTPGWPPALHGRTPCEDESNLLETPEISQLMAQTPLRGIKSLKSGSGWDDSMDGTIDEMEPHTPPKRLFGRGEDVDQEEDGPEEDTGSFVEEDTVLGVPLRDGSGGKGEYREEEEFREDEGVVLPKVLNFTTIRKGADSPDEDEDDQPLPSSATSATHLHPVTKSPGASARLPKVDIPLERFVTKLWSSAGDTLVPGHNYNVGKGVGTKVPPNASETIELLIDIAGSFSISSPPSDDTKMRILTARMFHYLLVEKKSSDPPYSAGQSELRQVLAEKAIECSWPDEDGLAKKVYFAWVGKKLVRPMKGRTVECCFD